MGDDPYERVPIHEGTRDKARVTKAKLGYTWDELVAEAAEVLDPDAND